MSAFEPTSDLDAQGSIFFSGTATTVIRVAGYTLWTDPNLLHQGETCAFPLEPAAEPVGGEFPEFRRINMRSATSRDSRFQSRGPA